MHAPDHLQHLQPTQVVTCILLRTDQQERRVLLVRRSQQVGSYHGHWAGVSGFVEPNVTPDEQAYTEILEETGLQRHQVRMLRRGAVVEHRDVKLGRHFSIHPFLFEVFTPDAIHIDWEATEMRWFQPQVSPPLLFSPAEQQPFFETIPKLQEVYESALRGEVVE